MLQVLLNLIDFELPLPEAVHAPRLHFEDDLLSVEGGVDLERIRPLLDAYPSHHLWDGRNMFFGGTHCVLAEGPRLSGDRRPPPWRGGRGRRLMRPYSRANSEDYRVPGTAAHAGRIDNLFLNRRRCSHGR